MPKKYDFTSSENLLKESFGDTQLLYVESLVNSILETESFVDFSKYTKGVAVIYFKAFLYRLTSLIWVNYADYNSNIETFFKPMTSAMVKQVATIKKELLERKILSDAMSETQMAAQLATFFQEYESRVEFKKIQKSYLIIKEQFERIIELSQSFYNCGEHLVKCAADLTSLYLRYKEAIFKGMGFDVALEYFSVDRFAFIYRDARLQDPEKRTEYERIVMNAALKAAMPGFDGDITVFENVVKNI